MKKRALISVYDKTGILELANFLVKNNVEIISTGGTYKYLKENGINLVEISNVTKFPEILDGRVKTLNPYIHGGILAIRDKKEHMETLLEHKIGLIDYVIVNLYPFFDKIKENLTENEKIEFIDIGGPSMLRSAAKSFKDVVVLSNVNDYSSFMKELEENKNISIETRKKLAAKVFNLTSTYDAAIFNFLNNEEFPEYLNISYKKMQDLRYGENSHQNSAYYIDMLNETSMNNFNQLNGKELSFNNIRDMDIAYKVVCEFDEFACCVVKHSTPCGVAIGEDIYNSYMKAYKADPVSIFGGIVAFNNEVDEKTANELIKIFLEIVIAPSFSKGALEVLKSKKNLRIIKTNSKINDKKEYVKVDGGILVQDTDIKLYENLKNVTNIKISKEEMEDLIFGFKVSKFVKSNAIVIAKDKMTIGIGGGEVSRIWAAQKALERAKNSFDTKGAIMASDAFFPFEDVVILANEYMISSIIQPGGSINDEKSINLCNEFGISMIFTKLRHFKH